ncbi:2'-5' RNA ligase family protein [Myceligenerans pegani]|uniref:2'-5' RNA ligase family protein n=1 Tax=Myceligenerans pegani TaxID=2776917 RepID=A0ABR9N0B5_9MICO|nr:2'-5' RNA ligase family protein [Myceligenerans sp. TRM 65318]MBE1877095.1 2'-5' RNA ligase family protein [Myceligenerans sp. TRM 65318]MBE3019366.1 2'-5' RNA ligase family protein [Myceligenerans sp. TRM 65318]
MNIPDRAPGQVRIGIAVAVPEPYAGRLAAARSAAGDPLADLIPPHITLLGPTVIDQSDLDKVRDHLDHVAASVRPFEVHLRGTATFRPVSPVVFVALAQGIAECETIESRVRTGMLAQDLRFNYHPHVTIAHEVPDDRLDKAYEALRDFEARFEVTSFWQYEHGDDGVWRPQCEFGLGR